MFIEFLYLLRERGVPVGLDYALEFYRGLKRGLARDLEQLFLLARLCFVKRPEHLDPFERAFAWFFFGADLPPVAEGDPAVLETKQFRDWLREAVARGELRPISDHLSPQDLMERFWQTVREQMEAHHGGSKWVGTGGSSPFGHSGAARRGVRVHGQSRNRSALKVIGERRYVDYSDAQQLDAGNLRQALATLKNLKPHGAPVELDIPETVYRTGRSGGEIELVFRPELRDKIEVILLLDNGGSSMAPFAELTRTLFQRVRDRFRACRVYFFHNTIYEYVYTDARRSRPFPVEELLRQSPESRALIVGDASMAPEELFSAYGSVDFTDECPAPSAGYLRRIRERFPRSVWLNPIPAEAWKRGRGPWTLQKIREIFPMEDLSLGGLKRAVERLNRGA